MVRIPVNSGVINGTYVCLEVLISLLLVRFINIILGCWNVKRIHDDRKVLHLSRARCEAISGGAHSSKNAYAIAISVIMIAVVLVAMGGLSFVGVTEPRYEMVRVKNLVKKGAPGKALDLRKHIIHSEGLMSGAVFLLLQFSGCQRRSQEMFQVLEYWNNLDDVISPIHALDSLPVPNQTCLSARSGYYERISLQRNESQYRHQVRQQTFECYTKFQWTQLQGWNLTQVNFRVEGECQYSATEVWCFRHRHNSYDFAFCAVGLKSGKDFAFDLLSFHPSAPEHSIIHPIPVDEELATGTLVSMTLLGPLFRTKPIEVYFMSLLTVERNAYVQKLVGHRSVTEVNIWLLAASLGPAIMMLAFIGILALTAWLKVLVLPGRLSYNRFCSSMEILSFAACKLMLADRNSHLRGNSEVVVGISPLVPHVGPLGVDENEGKSNFLEDELVGR